MDNLNAFGESYISDYINSYSEGRISYRDVKLYLNHCFNNRAPFIEHSNKYF